MKAKTIVHVCADKARTQKRLCQNCYEKWLRLDTPLFINDIAATEIACRDRNRKEAAMEIAVCDGNREGSAIEIARDQNLNNFQVFLPEQGDGGIDA